MYNLLWVNHEEIKNLDRPINSKEIESINRNLPTVKMPGLHDFTGEIYQSFKERLTESFSKSFKNWRRENIFSLYEASFTQSQTKILQKQNRTKQKTL